MHFVACGVVCSVTGASMRKKGTRIIRNCPHGGVATVCCKCRCRWEDNGGVAKVNGGRRKGAGRKSKAQKALERAAKKRKGEGEMRKEEEMPEVRGLPKNKKSTTPPLFFFFIFNSRARDSLLFAVRCGGLCWRPLLFAVARLFFFLSMTMSF